MVIFICHVSRGTVQQTNHVGLRLRSWKNISDYFRPGGFVAAHCFAAKRMKINGAFARGHGGKPSGAPGCLDMHLFKTTLR